MEELHHCSVWELLWYSLKTQPEAAAFCGLVLQIPCAVPKAGAACRGKATGELRNWDLQQIPLRQRHKSFFGSQCSFKSKTTWGPSCQQTQAQSHWDDIQQLLSGDSFLNLSLAKVLFVTGMGQNPFRPYKQLFQCCTLARLRAALLNRSPWALSLFYIPRFQLVKWVQLPRQKGGTFQLSGLPWSVYQI